jgi:plastocyanin
MLDELWDRLIAFSEQFIVPDWGALVALLPVFLAFPVVLYLIWILYRLLTAGPTSRGYRRQTPVTPEGIHMPGPSFAPLFAAFGAFMLLFGLLAGGPWLWAGLLVLVITLLYWGREALREYDHLPSVAAEHGAPVGALPAPGRMPPTGVHMPGPSFRPLLVALAMTMLVVGMVIGGWALLLGLGAVVLTGLGWLRDARREYVAVEAADRTGHLDAAGAPAWPRATLASLAIIVGLAIVLTSGILTGPGEEAAPSGGPATSGDAGGSAGGGDGASGEPVAPASPAASLPAADVAVTAEGIAYLEKEIGVPADQPFTIAFDNRDAGVPHDIDIRDTGGTLVFDGEVVTGPVVVVYDVPALPAGQYPFVCSIHPNMTGTMTAQ